MSKETFYWFGAFVGTLCGFFLAVFCLPGPIVKQTDVYVLNRPAAEPRKMEEPA